MAKVKAEYISEMAVTQGDRILKKGDIVEMDESEAKGRPDFKVVKNSKEKGSDK